jgi:2-polyprenyl-3-methyl-5-hydroxy-6-metoxy-1,4-benzoquinol methylase
MINTYFHRETCRLCDSSNMELVVKLEPIPLSENYCNDSETGKKAARFPVDLYMCTDCGHVHQLDVVDSKSLWENYTYYSGEAKGMSEHLKHVASKIIESHDFPSNAMVIDIGSNDGTLLRPFKNAGYRVLGIDPAREIAKTATKSGIETLPELMSLSLGEDISKKWGKAHVVCMFNAFAHADNLAEIAESIRTMLAPDGIFVFEAQYLLDIIDRMLIATIFHEHMSHHSVKALTIFFASHGLELIDVERVEIQHGSIIGKVQLIGSKLHKKPSVQQLLDLEARRGLDKIQTLKNFGRKIMEQRERTSKLVNTWKKEGLTIAGYGAARSGPTLISQLGLTDLIEFIVDDHPQKVNKFSSGDGIRIRPTADLCNLMPAYTIILAWVHSKKIIEDNKEYLNKGGKFVILCPETRVIGKEGEVVI